jgi:NADPH-dependent 2,4-dienoyl-CoA reductase/sulfur reductase-like enzyme/nitrite reductase/ring-hydroxylating ferredoxin subunit
MPTVRVTTMEELERQTKMQVNAGDTEILLISIQGRVHALAAHCPHQHAPLVDGVIHGDRLVCPWHQAVFQIDSGDLLEPPALDALPSYPVQIENGDVFVELPEEPPVLHQPELTKPERSASDRLIVIVGGGAAGTTAAQELRRSGFDGRVVLISADERAPYDRTHCSKAYLSGQAPAEWMPLKPPEFFTDAGIERVTATISHIDAHSRTVHLPGGSLLEADGLLIATGSSATQLPIPGADAGGVYTLRTWDDADAIAATADQAEHAVVFGASFIAMEVAASLVERGLASVTVVAPEQVPFANVLGERVGEWLRRLHERNGVQFQLGRTPKQVFGQDTVTEVELDNGSRFAADLVVIGVGVEPSTAAIEGLELREDGSLLTDELLRAAPGVYAAGDIATFPDWRSGELTRIEHWRTASQQGMIAGRNLAGAAQPFRAVPFFWTMQHGTPIGYVGHAPSWDEEIEHGEVTDGDFLLYLIANDRVAAAVGAGSWGAELPALHELMQLGREPSVEALRKGEINLVERLGGGGTGA